MEIETLKKIRDSLAETLAEIEALAEPAMFVAPELSSEQEQQLKESLSLGKFISHEPLIEHKCSFHPIRERHIYDIVHTINVLAMANVDVLHVFTSFHPQVNEFQVYAHSADSEYRTGCEREFLVFKSIDLGKPNALEKILSIESQVTELIIEAREQAEEKAEVKS